MIYQKFFNANAVRTARDPLVQLLRVIFFRRNITTNDFVQLHGNYWKIWNRDGADENESTHRNNQRRALLDNFVSWKKFWWIISDLLRLEVIRLSITIKTSTGEEITYASDDPVEDGTVQEASPDYDMAFGGSRFTQPSESDSETNAWLR